MLCVVQFLAASVSTVTAGAAARALSVTSGVLGLSVRLYPLFTYVTLHVDCARFHVALTIKVPFDHFRAVVLVSLSPAALHTSNPPVTQLRGR